MSEIVTKDGQVAIPRSIRDHLGIAPGSAVEFELDSRGGAILRPVGEQRKLTRERLEALVGTATAGLTTDEIMAMTRGDD